MGESTREGRKVRDVMGREKGYRTEKLDREKTQGGGEGERRGERKR